MPSWKWVRDPPPPLGLPSGSLCNLLRSFIKLVRLVVHYTLHLEGGHNTVKLNVHYTLYLEGGHNTVKLNVHYTLYLESGSITVKITLQYTLYLEGGHSTVQVSQGHMHLKAA